MSGHRPREDVLSRRPVIGITSYATQARWGPWDEPAALIPLAYCRAVEAAGGRPVILPPVTAGIDETLNAIDALVMTGGNDLDPVHYGEQARTETTGIDPVRDEAELDLLRAAVDRDMPVLGICRGMQLINVVYGGTLHQHIPDLVGSERHRERWGTMSEHEVEIAPGSRLAQILGTRAPIKSSHHQAPNRLGDGLHPVATAVPDGTLEGVEDPARGFVIGVLWHPEESDDLRLFEALVVQARRR